MYSRSIPGPCEPCMRSTDLEKSDPVADDLVRTLMNAYIKTNNRSTKTQVLSQYSKKTAPTIWEVIDASNSHSTMPRKKSQTHIFIKMCHLELNC